MIFFFRIPLYILVLQYCLVTIFLCFQYLAVYFSNVIVWLQYFCLFSVPRHISSLMVSPSLLGLQYFFSVSVPRRLSLSNGTTRVYGVLSRSFNCQLGNEKVTLNALLLGQKKVTHFHFRLVQQCENFCYFPIPCFIAVCNAQYTVCNHGY